MGDVATNVAVGAEINRDGHGMVDVVAAGRGWRVALLTDTLELSFRPEHQRGRSWLDLRGQAGAAGLAISPWTRGEPDVARAQLAFTAALQGGSIAYGPGGTWVGLTGGVTRWAFAPKSEATGEVSEDRTVGQAAGVFGVHRSGVSGWGRVGVDVQLAAASPFAHGQATWSPDEWLLAPYLQIHAGTAENADVATATRLGGLNPYVVPLAGAAWAEFWVEDYAAVRAGPALNLGDWTLAPVGDVATFDADAAYGLALTARWEHGRWDIDGAVGVAPDLDRPDGVTAGAAYFRLAYGPIR